MKTEILKPTEANLNLAAQALEAGELVAFPTETVYGLGANALNDRAVRAVFTAKGRPADHPLILHLGRNADPAEWSSGSSRQLAEARLLAASFWPGPLTLVLPRSERVADSVTGQQDTVALRVPAHDVALGLLARTGFPLVAPSANRFGRISPTTAAHVLDELDGQVRFVLDGGASDVGVESTILDLAGTEPRLLRPGALDTDTLATVLGQSVHSTANAGGPRVSGSMSSHYAPAAPARFVSLEQLEAGPAAWPAAAGVIATVAAPKGFAGHWRMLPAEPVGYARHLYATLRELDALADVILVQELPVGKGWEAVQDRLQRATFRQEPSGT